MGQWTETGDGYRTKTIQSGKCTIVLHRPILAEKERAKREQQVRDAMSGVMREYYKRKESLNVHA